MRIKLLISGVIIVCFIISIHAQEVKPFDKYNGLEWNGMNKPCKLCYIEGVLSSAHYIYAYIFENIDSYFSEKMLSALKRGRHLTRSERDLIQGVNKELNESNPERIYGSLILDRYIKSLDEFYTDLENIPIPIAAALTVVKKKIDGEPKETVDKYIISLREKYEEEEEIQQTNK
jgi:hypothetical protein